MRRDRIILLITEKKNLRLSYFFPKLCEELVLINAISIRVLLFFLVKFDFQKNG